MDNVIFVDFDKRRQVQFVNGLDTRINRIKESLERLNQLMSDLRSGATMEVATQKQEAP